MAQEQAKKTEQGKKEDRDVQAVPNPKAQKKAGELKDTIDEIVDEIDEVLEENAEEFVKNYKQKGGE